MLPEIVSALHGCLVPSCPGGNDNVLYEKDFAEYRANIDQKLSELKTHVSSWVRSDLSSADMIEILSLATLLRGEHSKKALWTTESSPRLSQDIFQSLTSAYESSHSINIFNDSKIVKAVLSLLRPHLLRDTFRCNPAASACYGWFLTQIQYSIMGDFLQEFFPTALILADDYEPANIQLGLESLSYIIENIAVEKLKWYGQDEVILDVLNKCLYLREAPIVSAHLKCFISLMSKDLRHNKSLKRFSYDEIVKKILVNMYMEQKLDLRRVYASQLTQMVEARGLGVVRHLTIIMKILSEYTLESSTTADALRAMTKVVQVCWCRGDSVGQEVLVIFMKVLILSSQNPPQIQFTLISSEVHQLAVVLQEAFPTVVEKYLHKMNENRSLFDPNILTLVSDVFSYQPSP